MGIDIAVVDGQGSAQSVVNDPDGLVAGLAQSWLQRSSLACLRFVDPYGDTLFNQVQLPHLLDDLDGCLQTSPSDAAREHLAQVRQLVASAAGRPHTYVRFIGD